MAVALYPGSFDPPTNGHLYIAERAARHFERVVVAVVRNPAKKPLFTAEERVELLESVLAHIENVSVVHHEGLTVELAQQNGAGVIVKGLRAMSDLESELQMAQMNSRLYPDVDTLFIASDPQWGFISSSLVREVASYGGSVDELVPPAVSAALKRKSA